jgi:hypothetical protein
MTQSLILPTGATGTVETEMIGHWAGHRVSRPGARPRRRRSSAPRANSSSATDPASLKPAFASVDEAFVVINGKDLNRL